MNEVVFLYIIWLLALYSQSIKLTHFLIVLGTEYQIDVELAVVNIIGLRLTNTVVTDKTYLFLISTISNSTPQLLLYCAIFLYQCTKRNKACIITRIISFLNATQLIKQKFT